MKTLIILIGTSASGKSTLRELLVPAPVKTVNKITFSKSKKDWCYVGNGKAGSETIKVLAEFEQLILEALNTHEFVVVDTVRISDSWAGLVKRCSKRRTFKILLVHFDLPLKVLRERLLFRRVKIGLGGKNPKSAFATQDRYRQTILRAVESFYRTPLIFKRIHITQESLSPEELANQIINQVEGFG